MSSKPPYVIPGPGVTLSPGVIPSSRCHPELVEGSPRRSGVIPGPGVTPSSRCLPELVEGSPRRSGVIPTK